MNGAMFSQGSPTLMQWSHDKTRTKQFCFSFISDVVTCKIKQKQS